MVGERPSRPEGQNVADTAARLFRAQGRIARVVLPPSTFARATRLIPGVGADDWVPVDISGRGAQVRSVRVPLALAGATIVAAIDLQGTASPLGIWRAYAHPLVGVAAASSSSRASLAADLTLAFSPSGVLIGGTVGSLSIGVATKDLVAAELITLALRESGDEETGPWEDALVQRATELELGVTLPDQIKLAPYWAGSPKSPQSGALVALADRLALRLGLQTP